MKVGLTVKVSAINGRKLRRCLGLILILLMPEAAARAKVVPKTPIVVMIAVHDDAGVPWETIRAAENEASRVFREAGIQIDWQNCHTSTDASGKEEESKKCIEPAFPEHLHVRIVKRSIGLSPQTMGISYLSEDGSGCQTDVFYDPIEGLQTITNASMVTVLGHVTAHEIGHLLLGTNAHTTQGIMRAAWGHDELESARRGMLLFSVRQSRQMRERLASVEARRKDAPLVLEGQEGE
jgi:hypothetical protein